MNDSEREVLGPYDRVDIEGRDEHDIPLGRHRLKCGCKMEGTTMLRPCSEHKKTFHRFDENSFSIGYGQKKARCTGTHPTRKGVSCWAPSHFPDEAHWAWITDPSSRNGSRKVTWRD